MMLLLYAFVFTSTILEKNDKPNRDICRLRMQNNQVISHHQDERLTCFRRPGIPPKQKVKKKLHLPPFLASWAFGFPSNLGEAKIRTMEELHLECWWCISWHPITPMIIESTTKGPVSISMLVYHLSRCLLILMVIFPNCWIWICCKSPRNQFRSVEPTWVRLSHSARRSVAHRSVGFLSQLCILKGLICIYMHNYDFKCI